MTHIWNDPAEFTTDAVAGFTRLYARHVRQVPGGVVRRRRPRAAKVAVVVGGGSGHYPAFMGVVGQGLADGSVVGNVFTSPSTAQAYAVARAAQSGRGVVIAYGNYAGDVLNFGLAGERLSAEGIQTRQLIVTDDVASAPRAERERRRGIAGDIIVFKVLGAAAERGLDLDEVERLGRLANDRTVSLGVAYSGCTFPGADAPLFALAEGQMGLGLGIHGEPGLEDVPSVPSAELARTLVSSLLEERPADAGDRVAVIVNGLGATKYEELFVLWNDIGRELDAAGLTPVAPEVGELVTSLDMGGVSLTLCWLDDELEQLWLAPADAPAFRRGTFTHLDALAEAEDEAPGGTGAGPTAAEVPAVGDAASRAAAGVLLDALGAVASAMRESERLLGDLDAVAGDGDHGRGMVRGADHAHRAAELAAAAGWGAQGVLASAGDAWGEQAGGTSGVLWGAGLRAAAGALGNAGRPGAQDVLGAVDAFLVAVTGLGKAEPGDKTLVDAVLPFRDRLASGLGAGKRLAVAWSAAAEAATAAAQATAALSPRTGRARPLAHRSVGSPDPGAVSFARCVTAVGEVLVSDRTG